MKNKTTDHFLQLLRSDEASNVELAFQLVKGMPELAHYIEGYEQLFDQLIGLDGDIFGKEHMLELNNEYLDLAYLKIRKISRFIKLLTTTKSINLYENHLRSLPNEIGELKQLEELDLGDNRFKKWPSVISKQLTNLEELVLAENRLRELPEDIGNLRHLKILDLSNNALKKLPEGIGNLTQLHTLNLSENKLTTLPEGIGNLKSLTSLNLDYNPLPLSEIGEIKELLPNCELTFVPSRRIEDKYESLLWSNKPRKIREAVRIAQKHIEIKHLKLGYTDVAVKLFPNEIFSFTELESLDLAYKTYLLIWCF